MNLWITVDRKMMSTCGLITRVVLWCFLVQCSGFQASDEG